MSSEASVANAIGEMVDFFLPHCDDTKTLIELKAMASDRTRWRLGHHLFDRIRNKMLKADRKSDIRLQHQYSFEEICAKTLFNLSGSPAPFDDDSPFWVIPIALQFAAQLKLDDPYSMTRLLQSRSDG
ncbi:hypothetical protein [Novipirellula sp.]|uniref:hypothetical protein n=1 Tax=Novipirellula sp. TaxID=2795430 RepID=UPI0035647A15